MTNEQERKAAEQEYTVTAFDYPSRPVGSRDWTLFWQGWQARAALASQAQPVAWRYRYSKEGSWRFANESASKWAPNDRFEEEPLYATSVAAGEPQTQSPAPVVQVVEPLTEEEIIELRKNQSGRYGFAGLQPYGDTLQLSAAVQLACARKWGLSLKEN